MFFGCRPPEEETQYNVTSFQDPLIGNACELLPEEGLETGEQIERCQAQDGCQAVLDNSDKYLGCMPIPKDDGGDDPVPPAGDDDDDNKDEPPMPPAGDDDDYTPGADDDDDDDDNDYPPPPKAGDDDKKQSDVPEDYRCGDKGHKVLVCHQNCGSKGHVTICIAEKAWINAHVQNKHHNGEDHLGPCGEKDLSEDDMPQIEAVRLIQGDALVNGDEADKDDSSKKLSPRRPPTRGTALVN